MLGFGELGHCYHDSMIGFRVVATNFGDLKLVRYPRSVWFVLIIVSSILAKLTIFWDFSLRFHTPRKPVSSVCVPDNADE